MRRLAAIIGGIALAGCTNGFSLPPTTPTATEVKAERDAMKASGLSPNGNSPIAVRTMGMS